MATARIIHWRAYYENGAIYTDKADRVVDLPRDGILGLVVFTADGRKYRVTGGDYFFIDEARNKFGMDKVDAAAMALKYGTAFLIRGRWTDDATMKQVEYRMKIDAP